MCYKLSTHKRTDGTAFSRVLFIPLNFWCLSGRLARAILITNVFPLFPDFCEIHFFSHPSHSYHTFVCEFWIWISVSKPQQEDSLLDAQCPWKLDYPTFWHQKLKELLWGTCLRDAQLNCRCWKRRGGWGRREKSEEGEISQCFKKTNYDSVFHLLITNLCHTGHVIYELDIYVIEVSSTCI